MQFKMQLLTSTLALSLTLCVVGGVDSPLPHNGGMTALERLRYCKPWGKMETSILNKDGTYTHVDRIPWDLLCVASPDGCSWENGKPIFHTEPFKSMMLTDEGLYGLNSLTTSIFKRLFLFKTKMNHSDETEVESKNGCEGTVHPDLLPDEDEDWIALIKRGDCFFTQKLDNAVTTHGADGFIVYNLDDTTTQEVVMNITTEGLHTIMINNSVGVALELLDALLHQYVPHENLTYTTKIFTNITFVKCIKTQKKKTTTSMPVTVVTITFVVLMIVALAWLVVYYFQKHRNANKRLLLELKLQKAAKKALRKIGERVISTDDQDADNGAPMDCTYCLEALVIGETIRQLPCRHMFHKDCVDEWLIHNRTCPNCHDNIIAATGLRVKGMKEVTDLGEADTEMTEMTTMTPESSRQLLSNSQPIAGREENGSQAFGSQLIAGSQLLTDGQNMFLYVPNDVEVPQDNTLQIYSPQMQLQLSQMQLAEEQKQLLSPPETSPPS